MASDQQAARSPIVETRSGKVRGFVNDRGVCVYRDIPYAASAEGARRFLSPQREVAWSGVREAMAEGARCPQWITPYGRPELNATMTPVIRPEQPMSEDCLHVNVFTPDPQSGARPVMVWIHGGGFGLSASESAWYDGSNLCRRGDVVVVTLNHRLNVFGHLCLDDILGERFAGSGNNAIRDIVAALQWVRENIAAFGGDPGNVTLFGESGGGAKITTLLAFPAAKGLFQKAVVISGAQMRVASRNSATVLAWEVLKALGTGADADALQAAPVAAVIAAARSALRTGTAPVDGVPLVPTVAAKGGFQPVVDGVTLHAHPFDVAAPETSRDVPLIVGVTRDELQYWNHDDPRIWEDTLTPEELAQRVRPYAGARTGDVLEAYGRTGLSPARQWVAIETERGAWAASVAMIERRLQQRAAPSWFYIFDWESPALDGRYRAGHGVDIPFIMDNTDAAPIMVGDRTSDAAVCAATLSDALSAFARSGSPATAANPWPHYDATRRATMRFNVSSGVVDDPSPERRKLWIL